MRTVSLLICMYLLHGCAGMHKEVMATNASEGAASPLRISAEVNNRLSSEYFGMLEFTIENTTDQWIEIDRFIVDAGKAQNRHILFTLGKDFETWSRAILARNKIEDFNTAMAFGSIIAGAAVVSSNTSSDSLSDASRIVGGMTVASLGIEGISTLRDSAEGMGIIPEGHLLQEHIRVPPGLFVNAWLLMNTAHHEHNLPITEIYLEAYYHDGGTETFKIPLFRDTDDLGKYAWQSISQKYMLTVLAEKK
jgi:hypothetical protein